MRSKRRARDYRNSLIFEEGPVWGVPFGLSYDCLLCELDPYLFAADASLARLVESIYHGKRERGVNLFALLIPPHSGYSWAIPRISKLFSLYVDVDYDSDIALAACEQFSASCVAGFDGNQIPQGLDLIISEYYAWSGPQNFLSEVAQCLENLNASGVLVCVLIGGEDSVFWQDGTSTSLRDLCEGPYLPPVQRSLSLPRKTKLDINDVLLRGFHKRNRDYFSKMPLNMLRERILGADDFLADTGKKFSNGLNEQDFVHIVVF